MAEIATKPAPNQAKDLRITRTVSEFKLDNPNDWLALHQQEKTQAGQEQKPPVSLADLQKQQDAAAAEAAKKQDAQANIAPKKEYKASEAGAAVKEASNQAAATYNAIDRLGKADRDDRDPLKFAKQAIAGLADALGQGKFVENILGQNFKPDSVLAGVLGQVKDAGTALAMYRAALPGKRAFNADHVKAILGETSLMLEKAGDLIKTRPADEVSPASNKVGELAQRFLNVTNKLAVALRDQKPFSNTDFAEMLRITAELRENGMTLKKEDSQLGSKAMNEMKGLVNGKGEPNKEIQAILKSPGTSPELRDKINALVDQVKSFNPEKNGEERTTALLKLYAEYLANKP